MRYFEWKTGRSADTTRHDTTRLRMVYDGMVRMVELNTEGLRRMCIKRVGKKGCFCLSARQHDCCSGHTSEHNFAFGPIRGIGTGSDGFR